MVEEAVIGRRRQALQVDPHDRLRVCFTMFYDQNHLFLYPITGGTVVWKKELSAADGRQALRLHPSGQSRALSFKFLCHEPVCSMF